MWEMTKGAKANATLISHMDEEMAMIFSDVRRGILREAKRLFALVPNAMRKAR
jgi:hypothetical protein